ncbi:hypothetical protein VHEMI09121 [[Torrubiella] hemipterigena]|uniref:sarcosine oxidasee (formaldehyde-forming) n=1 Tax=[Torrubiella] hemipterigena TaxID=1531966 RepID=A0A0A1TPG3_9HYPO|nr:hypothetical protein VHEMI09121 [[Torrubiella] hemipterigena]
MSQQQHYDVAVVGLGALGSAAAFYAAHKGAKVIAFEQFELGHVRGASHDTSRIVRTSYEAPQYVALAKSAYKDWADVEKASGQQLLSITGGVVFLPKGGPLLARDFAQSLDANQVPYELLNSAQVAQRWPQFKIADTVDVVYTPDTGIAHASRSVAAMTGLARNRGATILEKTTVEYVKPKRYGGGGGVVVGTTKGAFHADKVILATDAWTNKLLAPLNASIPLSIMQEQITYFKPANPDTFEPAHFPVWIWHADPCFYGFPSYGEPTIKAGRDQANNYMTPEQRTFVHSPQLLQQLTSFMDGFIPDKDRQALRTVTCQYTITPDRQFIISPLVEHPDIILGLGAAHGFKFAPAIGRILAELAIDGRTTDDISKFGIPPVNAKL